MWFNKISNAATELLASSDIALRRPLAIATGSGVELIGVPAELLICLISENRLVRLPWHEIDQAKWDPSNSKLLINSLGNQYEFQIVKPGKIPQLIQDRVQATIIISKSERVIGGEVIVAIRRELGGSERAFWQVRTTGQIFETDPVVQVKIKNLKNELRLDYDFPEIL